MRAGQCLRLECRAFAALRRLPGRYSLRRGPEDALGGCTKIPFDLGNFYGNDASSSYNAFEAKVEKRFALFLLELSACLLVVDLLLGQSLYGHYHVGMPGSGSTCSSPETSCSGNCVDLNSDSGNCGTCGNDCTTMGPLFSCGGGTCVCNDVAIMCESDGDCCPGDTCFMDTACVSM